MPSIAEILVEQGRVLADQRRRSGERRGALVTGLGQIPVQIVADRQAAHVAANRAALAQQEVESKRQADARAQADLELRQNADTRAQTAADDARMADERGRQAIQGWMKQHAATLKPEESARMSAILEMPGGAKHLVEQLSKAPEPFKLVEHDPTKDMRNPETGALVVAGVPKAPEAPKPAEAGSLADAVQRYATENGKTVAQVTGREINKLIALRAQAGHVDSGNGGGSGKDDPRLKNLMAQIDENPSLWDTITPTLRSELALAGYAGQGKPLSNQAITKISESKSALASVRDLREVLQANEQYIGPIGGLASLNPYSEARKAQADIDRVKQRVGKTLEGGVLRKEDEEKYKKILATLFDEPTTAIYKVDQLLEDLQRDMDIYIGEQRAAGRRVGTAPAVPLHPGGALPAAAKGPKVGDVVTVRGKQYTVGTVHPDGSWDPK